MWLLKIWILKWIHHATAYIKWNLMHVISSRSVQKKNCFLFVLVLKMPENILHIIWTEALAINIHKCKLHYPCQSHRTCNYENNAFECQWQNHSQKSSLVFGFCYCCLYSFYFILSCVFLKFNNKSLKLSENSFDFRRWTRARKIIISNLWTYSKTTGSWL